MSDNLLLIRLFGHIIGKVIESGEGIFVKGSRPLLGNSLLNIDRIRFIEMVGEILLSGSIRGGHILLKGVIVVRLRFLISLAQDGG